MRIQRGASTNLGQTPARNKGLPRLIVLSCTCMALLASPRVASPSLHKVIVSLPKYLSHIYPRWDIAFARIFGYTDSVEVLLISAPHMMCDHYRGHV